MLWMRRRACCGGGRDAGRLLRHGWMLLGWDEGGDGRDEKEGKDDEADRGPP